MPSTCTVTLAQGCCRVGIKVKADTSTKQTGVVCLLNIFNMDFGGSDLGPSVDDNSDTDTTDLNTANLDRCHSAFG